MATTVRITETYDLKTTVNKIGIIGIHTPTDTLLRNLYPGLIRNHKFVRFLKCDVFGACASVLPADPLQVGISAGSVAPEDMFNPILYKAVTNTSFDTLVNRIYAGSNAGSLGSVSVDEPNLSSASAFNVYYSLLSEHGRFKKSMPQTGFAIKHLVPICHTLLSQYGNLSQLGNKKVDTTNEGTTMETDVSNVTDINEVNDSLSNTFAPYGDALVFRGKSVKMPRIPLHYDLDTMTGTVKQTNIPKTYVACLVIPPAKLHEFYYRMRVTWTVRFEGVMSNIETASANGMGTVAGLSYYKGYEFSKSTSELPTESTSVDADGVNLEKIMQS